MFDKRALVALIVIGLILTVTLYLVTRPPEQPQIEPPVNQAPILTITTPIPGLTVQGLVTINVTIDDEETLNATIFIDGTPVAVANHYEWNSSTTPDGKHTIRAQVTDSGELSD